MNSIDIFSLMKISNPKIIDIRDNYTYVVRQAAISNGLHGDSGGPQKPGNYV